MIVKEPAAAGRPVLVETAPFDSLPFMPILSPGGEGDDLAGIARTQTQGRKPVAIELPRMLPTALPAVSCVTRAAGTRLWVNSPWDGFVQGYGGDVEALRAPDAMWGRIQRDGVSVIQTDEPEALLRFLRR